MNHQDAHRGVIFRRYWLNKKQLNLMIDNHKYRKVKSYGWAGMHYEICIHKKYKCKTGRKVYAVIVKVMAIYRVAVLVHLLAVGTRRIFPF